MKEYAEFKDVPWYRRSMIAGIMAFWGLLAPNFLIMFGRASGQILMTALGLISYAALVLACVACLTGGIFENKKDANGKLKTWGVANKVVAFIFLLIATKMVYGALTVH